MKLISEYKLDNNTIKMYRDKGLEIFYGYEDFKIKAGEAVGILLDTMYKSTIELIEYLLFTKHHITLKYKDKQYKLQSLDEWKITYKDGHKTCYKKHPLLIEYECKRLDYLEQLERQKNKLLQQEVLTKYNYNNLPTDLDAFVDTFAKLYNITYDYNNDLDKIVCYNQLKSYMDLGLSYMNEDTSTAYTLEGQQLMYSNCIDISEQDIFPTSAFKDVTYQEPIKVTSYGNSIYLEDTIYKESGTNE